MMRCHKCQAEIDEADGRDYCPKCFTTIRHGGLLRRMWQALVDWVSDRASWHSTHGRHINLDEMANEDVRRVLGDLGVTQSRANSVNTRVVRSQKIVIDDSRTGRKLEFDRWEDVPAEYRRMLEPAAGSLCDAGVIAAGEPSSSAHDDVPPSLLQGPPDEVIDLLASDKRPLSIPLRIEGEVVQRQEFDRSDMHKLPAAIRALVIEFDIDIPRELQDVKSRRTSSNISLEVRTKSDGGKTVQRYVFRGPDGQERIYGSLEDMPMNVRKMFERLDQMPRGGE